MTSASRERFIKITLQTGLRQIEKLLIDRLRSFGVASRINSRKNSSAEIKYFNNISVRERHLMNLYQNNLHANKRKVVIPWLKAKRW